MRNVILSDVDGCLLNWEDAFETWMLLHKGIHRISYTEFDHYGVSIAKSFNVTPQEADVLIGEFNTSDHIAHLAPLRDAVKYVRKLYEEHGYVFHVITSFGTDKRAIQLRQDNLDMVFGKGVVQRLVALDHNISKEEALSHYSDKGMVFIEDRKSNADLAIELGIEGILIEHAYNVDYTGDATRVYDWKEIYNYIAFGDVPFYHRQKEYAKTVLEKLKARELAKHAAE
jgi:FMN phosphatase YigB (HAD superfamily)